MAHNVPERGVSVGLLALLMLWFVATAALFVGLIVAARQWVTSEEQVTLLLGHVAWPYVAFVLSVPVVAVLAGRIGEIFALRNDIKKIPDILTDALAKAEELEVRVARISAQATNSVSALAGVLESKIEVWGEQLRPAQAGAQEDAASPPSLLPKRGWSPTSNEHLTYSIRC